MGKVLLIFYLLVGSGYLLKKLKVFKKEDTTVFTNYIIHFALPVAVFSVIHDFEFSLKDLLIPLTAWITIVFSFFVVYLFIGKHLEEKTRKTLFLSSTFGNTAFVGYPIAYTLFGDKGLAYAIIYDTIGNFLLVVSFAIFVITGRIDWRMLYKFPPLGALVLAFLTKPISLAFIKPFIATVKNSITPTILFAVGLRFEPKGAFKNLKLAAFAVFWRQIIIPLSIFLFLLVISRYAEFPKTELAVILLQSATPPFVMSVILSEKFKLNTDLAVAAVNAGLLFLLISLPLWYKIAMIFFF